MKIYISGPITGIPNGNIEAFCAEGLEIIRRGHEPIDPHVICAHLPHGSDWKEYMRVCISQLCMADIVHVIPGLEKSRGAQWEVRIAKMLGIPVENAYTASVQG